ncbi:hypothetical protein NLJ89_g8137 [Agrocybe chaxingu]|uniref:Phosphatidate phosphatase APP1 catalytic domain-containing protein n=1 Tax=Agrocybe chaxingu TaxID=84603 RepID=A0A9W8MUS7_9AGAR|nr:hypothetical protein NLJ89_g8137 [Agrocybe chaxingu]
MSEDMSSSWRYLNSASSRLSNLKGYIRESGANLRAGRSTPDAHDGEQRQSWRAWAGQKIRVRRRGAYDPNSANEIVNLFPGWAARRYLQGGGKHEVPTPFEVEVLVSGYAISYRSAENASRSQRAFIRLAKGFASLPKLVENAGDLRPNAPSLAHLTPSTEELLAHVKLPPRPTEITDDFDVDALERQLKDAKDSDSDTSSISSSRSSTYELDPSSSSRAEGKRPHIIEQNSTVDVLRGLHANLEKRLQPFWSSVLPNRVVRLHLFASPHQEEPALDSEHGPLASEDVYTAVDGSFQARFRVKWEDLCQHPRALHIAFGEAVEEHELLVVAQLLPLPSTPSSASSSNAYSHTRNRSMPNSPSHSTQSSAAPQPSAPLASLARIPITHSPIRVISDIDDTVKLSGVLSGARAVFHNVFVKDLRDNVIPGMGEWYAAMWSRGIRFHYVSNGPFEILPVLNEFFQISQLPPGSIKLRSYAGRSLFNGLMSAPAARKRAGVVDVLDSFPDSQFFLIGDTGEQDLELYADLARERPTQILGVFLRDADASTFEGPLPLDDPTGWNAMGAAGTRPNERPLVSRTESGYGDKKTKTPDESMVRAGLAEDEHETPKPNQHPMDAHSLWRDNQCICYANVTSRSPA